MADTKFTLCPFTGKKGWVEFEGENGKWFGKSLVNGDSIAAQDYEGLRLRYQKLLNAHISEATNEED